mgnify:CR=1 FL=1|tara:strand:- start:1093 stop:1308 length:216 start_codon:yes stop_codon:yes gene_type:complete
MGLARQFLPREDLKSHCPSGEEHRWRTFGDARATNGNNIVINFGCTKCDRKTSIFITHAEYKLYEKQLRGL